MSDPHPPAHKEGEVGHGAHAGMIFSHGKWIKAPVGKTKDELKEHH